MSGDATLRWNSRKVFVSNIKGRSVGLKHVGDGVRSVHFGPIHLGWLNETDYASWM